MKGHTESLNHRIISLNIKSLIGKFYMLTALILTYKISICAVQETKLSSNVPDWNVSVPGYTIFRKDRSRNGGGVALIIKSELKPVMKYFNSKFEIIVISIQCLNMIVVSMYRPPNMNANETKCLLNDLSSIKTVFSDYKYHLYMGDMNINMNDTKSSSIIHEFCSLNTLKQIVSNVTHINAIIDHVYLSENVIYDNVHNLDPIEKHHTPILFTVKLDVLTSMPICSKTICKWSDVNWEEVY